MRQNFPRKRRLIEGWGSAVCLALLILQGFVRPYGLDGSNPSSDPQAEAELPEAVIQKGHPMMDYHLGRLVEVYGEGGPESAAAFALKRGLEMRGEFVRVIVEAESPIPGLKTTNTSAELMKSRIRNLGGQVETAYGSHIQGWMPVNGLSGLAASSAVRFIRLPDRSVLDVVSEGVAATGADRWQSLAPYRVTHEVNICVLDSGFQGYDSLLGTELPASLVARSFRANGDMYGDHNHGTACAEIVYDMAPQANLFLVTYDTYIELGNAIDWIIDNDIHIVSNSSSWLNNGPGDGTGPYCELVKKVDESGILWVNSAGNYAMRHWSETFRDTDRDGYHNFPGGDEILQFNVHPGASASIYFKWDDWGGWDGRQFGGSDQDYDLVLYYWNGSQWVYAVDSAGVQDGSQWPREQLYNIPAGTWGVGISRYRATRNVYFTLLILNASDLEYNTPTGSLGSPADSPYALTVGAVDWSDDAYHTYSSQGPTLDGRIKPDLCAPSGVSTQAYGALTASFRGAGETVGAAQAFYGTSAAAPHVAGAVALLYGKTPYTFEQVLQILGARLKELGSPGKDNQFGWGRLKLTK